MHWVASLSSQFSLFILFSLWDHGSTKRQAWLYWCDWVWMSFTAYKLRALHLFLFCPVCVPYSFREGGMCYCRACWLCRFRAELFALCFDSLIKNANLLSLYIMLGVPLKVHYSQGSLSSYIWSSTHLKLLESSITPILFLYVKIIFVFKLTESQF